MTSVLFSYVGPALRDLLDAELPAHVLVGYGEPPEGAATTRDALLAAPYLVVHRTPIGDSYVGAGYTGKGGMQTLRFQLRAVAATDEQGEALADDAAAIVADRDGAGGWVTDLVVPGHAVVARERVGEAPSFPEGLFANVSTFVEITVQVT